MEIPFLIGVNNSNGSQWVYNAWSSTLDWYIWVNFKDVKNIGDRILCPWAFHRCEGNLFPDKFLMFFTASLYNFTVTLQPSNKGNLSLSVTSPHRRPIRGVNRRCNNLNQNLTSLRFRYIKLIIDWYLPKNLNNYSLLFFILHLFSLFIISFWYN